MIVVVCCKHSVLVLIINNHLCHACFLGYASITQHCGGIAGKGEGDANLPLIVCTIFLAFCLLYYI